MHTLRYLVAAVLLCLCGCLNLDGFLANEEALDDYELPGNTIPENLIEMVTFESDGNTLYGFWVAASENNAVDTTILYCEGNKHNIDEYWDRVTLLHETGANVFIFDYRSFGRSEGEFSESAMLADARAAYDYLLSRPDVDPQKVGLYGYSLGNVASIYLAAEVFDPEYLIAEAPFASSTSLVQGSLGLALPAGWLTDGTFDNANRIRAIHAPLLLMHGENDDFVRYRDNGRIVFENAPDPKSLVLVPGARHNNIPEVLGLDVYRSIIRDWIDR